MEKQFKRKETTMRAAGSYLSELQNIRYDLEMSISKLVIANPDNNFSVTIKDIVMKPAIKDVNRRRSLIFTDGKSGILASKLSIERLADAYEQMESQLS